MRYKWGETVSLMCWDGLGPCVSSETKLLFFSYLTLSCPFTN